jgi:iron(III) transport system permease protein
MIWYMWDNGDINGVGAIGVMLMSAMFALAILMRLVGFGRQRGMGTTI